jgi:hypothetical protein
LADEPGTIAPELVEAVPPSSRRVHTGDGTGFSEITSNQSTQSAPSTTRE